MKKNAFYAQSGGVTSVINASASAVILEAKKYPQIGKVFAGKNGILGALREELIDTSKESKKFIEDLQFRPGGVFGSCRYKLKGIDESLNEYLSLIEVFKAHNIGYFFIMVEMTQLILRSKYLKLVRSLTILCSALLYLKLLITIWL